jgi:hypothetical protein
MPLWTASTWTVNWGNKFFRKGVDESRKRKRKGRYLLLTFHFSVNLRVQPGNVQGLSASFFWRRFIAASCASDRSMGLPKILFFRVIRGLGRPTTFRLDASESLLLGGDRGRGRTTLSCTGEVCGLPVNSFSKIYRINHSGIVNGPRIRRWEGHT